MKTRLHTPWWPAAVMALALLSACGGGDDEPTPNPTPEPTPTPVPKGDPLAYQQWFLDNTGQTAFASQGGVAGVDLNVRSVHESGNLGQGVKVLVLDTGVEIRHEDLADNIDPAMLWSFDPKSVVPTDPTPIVIENGAEAHGTAVSGLIAAVANNGLGGSSVAPQASLGAVRYLCDGPGAEECQSSLHFIQSLGQAPFSRDAWVINASFGEVPVGPELIDEKHDARLVALRGLAELRNGKGVVLVKAAGNSFNLGDDAESYYLCESARSFGLTCHNASTEVETLVPNTVVVGAVNASGTKSSYSSAGSSLLVAGAGGEFGIVDSFVVPPMNFVVPGPAMVTVDWSGCDRGEVKWKASDNYRNPFINPGSEVAQTLNVGCRYSSVMSGTSAATPTVTGVIALMLAANPDLTWRDIRDILVQTSRRDILKAPTVVDIPLTDGVYRAEPGWQTNAAGHAHSNWYGFGLVNAAAAVEAAQQRPGGLLKGALQVVHRDADAMAGDDDEDEDGLEVPPGSVVGATLDLDVQESLVIESVMATVMLDGPGPLGEVAIELISPSGTRSVLLNPFTIWGSTPAEQGGLGIPLASQAFYGENSKGTWQLRVLDMNTRNAEESEVTLDSFSLKLQGR